jgi:hypothetical protein
MNISPQLIPHSEFHKVAWLRSVERPSWYYYKKQKPHQVILNKDFLASVDEPLQELVGHLHQRGIKTTPSCSGHHIKDRNLEKIFSNLKEDEALITTCGIQMMDVESGELEHFKDKNYGLPWGKYDFVKELSEYQHKGVLGMKIEDEMLKSYMKELQFNGVRVKENDGIIFVFTNEDNAFDIRAIWKAITHEIKLFVK